MANHGDLMGRPAKASGKEEEYRRILEEALNYAVGPAKAKETVDTLWEDFGGFYGVICAPAEEMARTPGVGPEAAKFLQVTMELAKAFSENKADGMKRIFDTACAIEAFKPKFFGRSNEAVALILLDGRARMVYNQILNEGSVSEVPIYIRRLIQLCITYDSQEVLLAHNHPGGNAVPSHNDMAITAQIQGALTGIGAALVDHIIFAGEDVFSFAASGVLEKQRKEARMRIKDSMEDARRREYELFIKNEEPGR